MKLFIATVLSACLIGPASAFAIPADVHSSSLGAGPQAGQVVDLRSPDAQTPVQSAPVDLRSPDTQSPVQSTQPQPTASSPSGSDFDWGDAAIGAGTMLAIALVTLGVFLITGTTRRQHRSAV